MVGSGPKNNDVFSPEKRSEIMSKVRSKNSAMEREVFAYLRKKEVRFQRHYGRAIGKPDVAVPSKRKAVFVDSDFWHGWRYPQWEGKLTSEFWRNKIEANRKRDRKVSAELRKRGWRVLRVWEHNLKAAKKEKTLEKIAAFLSNP